ncbi:dihydroxyacetone kinase subunit DhaL [Clostridium oceanicum]|uniref:Dihydroxyacetone kinase subunit DhaL n=1 Tax=Clostridium oceanicum TaxID=1543 RepID=A0ABN1JFJ6_9CLOT
MAVNACDLKNIFKNISKVIEENEKFLSELDGAIGDGDHGFNMNKGFKAVIEKIDSIEDKDIGKLLKTVGMTLVTNVGGASGPLYGTAFMYSGKKLAGKEELNIEDLVVILEESLNGIKVRGKAETGEKTMVDSISPALDALKESLNNGLDSKEAMKNVVDAAQKGVEYTKDIIATKGRASYLGERSIGHQDPGATSSYLILKSIYETITT